MTFPIEFSDAEKARRLLDAGWMYGKTLGIWFAPNCTTGQTLHAAWQSFVLGKQCEQPLKEIE